ncbi:SH3 domain-containing protein 21 [Fundulus heteroclitus]|uniref:SH3 domain-containing protein 21 n=1 Tax=Fundulus heteroclitus TaxID=8078 RepID=UPI00165A78C1|nr:SH3 domain-containing protein 21 [Fundulus heteroclitus]XP_021180326.2 SH3 domain-containing protein 21 [Fundulus heteroclitus]XP_021180327.2 SH3 domain-containing protein 21 [Fundulus heteroclitus]
MEVLVLLDFEANMGDELTLRTGDVIKNVTKAEEGWLQGELRGKRGLFPANFVKEIPVYLIGDGKREPRSIRRTKKGVQLRKCEVAFPYSPQNEDELELVVGEILEIIREIEDGWWMGIKNGKMGAFPSNFVKEIFVSPKDGKQNESKARPKLSDALFSKEISRQASVRNKAKNRVEYCQVMFDYKASAVDELELKQGDIVAIVTKETEDEGWWKGELNGRCGFFPDNFVMPLPELETLQSGTMSKPPARGTTIKVPAKKEGTAMDKNDQAKAKDDKPEQKDLRTNPPSKIKLPIMKPAPPPIKEKPAKLLPNATNGDAAPISPKQPEKDADQFDGLDVQTEKLSHPTANRAKPPQRRPPSALNTAQTENAAEQTDAAEPSTKMLQSDKPLGLQKVSENLPTLPAKPELPAKVPPPVLPAFPKPAVASKTVNHKDEGATVESLQAEIKELRMALELLQTRQEQDMQEVKEELREERNKRLALQEEVNSLKTNQ